MQNEYVKKFTDFCLKYKRYIGAAALLLILLLVLVNCTGPTDDPESETQSPTQPQAVTETTQAQEVGKLEKDADAELTALIENYFTAYAAGDVETLEPLAQPLSDNEKSYIQTLSAYYESFENLVCYSTQGATEDSYLVSVCYDLKFKDIDTTAPGMEFFYVERDGKGNLVINNVYSTYNFNFLDQNLDADLYALVLAYEKSDEVIALQEDVQARYDEAVKNDEKLANMVDGTLRNALSKWRETIVETQTDDTQSTETQATESQQEEATEQVSEAEETTESETKEETTKKTKKKKTVYVKTTDICNVRKSPSTDGELLGRVSDGVKLKKLGTDGDWTKVKFRGETGYIKSDLLKTVKNND